MQTIDYAIQLAAQAHSGQTRTLPNGAEEAYVCHPLRVYTKVARDGVDLDARIAAILHDVVEDTHITITSLHSLGFSDRTVNLIELLTRTDGTYDGFIQKIVESGDMDAMLIKMADVTDNYIDAHGDYLRLRPRYKRALSTLQSKMLELSA